MEVVEKKKIREKAGRGEGGVEKFWVVLRYVV